MYYPPSVKNKKYNMRQLIQQNPILILSMLFANIGLSIWCLANDPVINYDGVLYVTVADLLLEGQWETAIDYYNWPFYSMAIAAVAKALFLPTETAAHVINTAFAISLCVAFVAIVADLSKHDKRLILIAALVIMFFPSITKYRSFVIRDFAYLSFYLWSLLYLLRYCRTSDPQSQVKNISYWAGYCVLATLFRIEGVIFLLITPYFLFLFKQQITDRQSLKNLIRILTVLLLVIGATAAWWYLNNKYEPTIIVAQQHGHDIHNVWDVFLMNIAQNSGIETLSTWNYISVITTNIGTVFYELVRRLAIFYLLFIVYAYSQKLGLNDAQSKRIWWVYLLTNIGLLLTFSLYNSFIVSRYGLATALTLLILAPFGIDAVLSKLKSSTQISNNASAKKVYAALIVFILAAVSIEGLNVKTNKPHIKQAGYWIGDNIPKTDRIFSNNKLAIYYADRGAQANTEEDYSNAKLQYLIDNGITDHFKYIALASNKSNQQEQEFLALLTKLYGKPVYHLTNSENSKRAISIFKTI